MAGAVLSEASLGAAVPAREGGAMDGVGVYTIGDGDGDGGGGIKGAGDGDGGAIIDGVRRAIVAGVLLIKTVCGGAVRYGNGRTLKGV